MRRFWFIVAAVMGALLLTLMGYYGTVVYDYNKEAKTKFENGTLFKRY